MILMPKHASVRGRTTAKALLAGLLLVPRLAPFAQEGHPLNGSWSGERDVGGKSSRILLVMELQRDQTITGYVIEDRKRLALRDVQLNPVDWSVRFALADGYSVRASIDELGSVSQRRLVGEWTDGQANGAFKVELN